MTGSLKCLGKSGVYLHHLCQRKFIKDLFHINPGDLEGQGLPRTLQCTGEMVRVILQRAPGWGRYTAQCRGLA